MEELTPIQKLDYVLYYIKNLKHEQVSDATIIAFSINSRVQEIVPEVEALMIIKKLIKDGYVNDSDTNEHGIKQLSVSFEGSVFIERGGYSDQALRDANDTEKQKREIVRLRNLDIHSEENQKSLNRLTLWLALGSGALALIELAKILMPAFQYYCHCQFVWQK
ncbi:MAG TPA: hypothetical protein VIJ27_09130 [Mucilaginibacter sp.]